MYYYHMPLLYVLDSSIPIFTCFLLDCYCPLRDVPSFPTRRSSDLLRRLPDRDRRDHLIGQRVDGDQPVVINTLTNRSEEHTSELQSPDHLVCRLLLEKKKISQKAHISQEITHENL